MNLSRRYTYRHVQTLRYGRWHYAWELVGAKGGMHLHITDLGKDSSVRYSAGLEVHYRTPEGGRLDEPPSQDECWLLKAPCWHDGTSLYAEEFYLPRWTVDPHNHELMFRLLAGDADEKFYPEAKVEGEKG